MLGWKFIIARNCHVSYRTQVSWFGKEIDEFHYIGLCLFADIHVEIDVLDTRAMISRTKVALQMF